MIPTNEIPYLNTVHYFSWWWMSLWGYVFVSPRTCSLLRSTVQKVQASEIPSVGWKSRFDWSMLLALTTISNAELSDSLCHSVNRDLTLVRLVYERIWHRSKARLLCKRSYFNMLYILIISQLSQRIHSISLRYFKSAYIFQLQILYY